MWKTEHTHDSSATPEAVFALWADVDGWPSWDASLIATTLDGPFAAGTTGTLHPLGMLEPIAFTLTAVEDGAGFADETRLGPLVLRFSHRVEPRPGGSRIVVSIEADGPDAGQVGPAVAEDLPESVA
ncbi:MAG TPA: SRPBCC family protein, partial [Gaiellales bacterium]|nr:SRPBCC family protein [Gaiellales bacterium]